MPADLGALVGVFSSAGINAGPYPNVTFSGDTVSNNSGFGGSGGAGSSAGAGGVGGDVTGAGIAIDGGNTSAIISDIVISDNSASAAKVVLAGKAVRAVSAVPLRGAGYSSATSTRRP